ncbi:MAG: hypothetical protein ACREEC_03000, partial [Thermoplasmata archaeon]
SYTIPGPGAAAFIAAAVVAWAVANVNGEEGPGFIIRLLLFGALIGLIWTGWRIEKLSSDPTFT